MGGQTTSAGIYYEGSIHFSKEIASGGDYITRDIAYGLGTTMPIAQEIKEKYGVVISNLIEEDKTISFTGMDGATKKEVRPRDLLEFIQPRAEEIFDRVNAAVQNSNYSDLPGGAILTGGSALLKGMSPAAEQLLDLKQSRLGSPVQAILECPPQYAAQPYMGALGLVCYPNLKTWNTDTQGLCGVSFEKRAWRWIKDLF